MPLFIYNSTTQAMHVLEFDTMPDAMWWHDVIITVNIGLILCIDGIYMYWIILLIALWGTCLFMIDLS